MSADVVPPRGSSADWSCEAHAYKVTALEAVVAELRSTMQRNETANQDWRMDLTARSVRMETKLDSVIPEIRERRIQEENRAREVLPRYVWPILMLITGAVSSGVVAWILRHL